MNVQLEITAAPRYAIIQLDTTYAVAWKATYCQWITAHAMVRCTFCVVTKVFMSIYAKRDSLFCISN